MTTESKKLASDTPNPIDKRVYIWSIDLSQSLDVSGKTYFFELDNEYDFTENELKNPWVESAILKGYLVSKK
jgi:hypothetical protein